MISPTFVLSRVHRSTTGRPPLVHVDAYRLSAPTELDDLDLDESAPTAVTVVEWGTGLAEGLADSRLEIDIRRSAVAAPSCRPARRRDRRRRRRRDRRAPDRVAPRRGPTLDSAELAALRELAGG